ncbi:stalk domain-containing protein [Paenibacillus elgii]|uniref:stalk domain-containing protein n=1 Tax=Paenibacillus elgii TaxID=189691 RepID=UPI0013D14A2B|nr:stalk domain-containing protein [Paenibacillus elgii]
MINYNGHAYVPLRFVAEQMAADIDYQEDKRTTYIQQYSVKFDERILTTAQRNRRQEIPLRHVGMMIKQAEYPPVSVKPESDIVVTYPKGMKPLLLQVTMASESDAGKNEGKAVPLDGNRLHLPKQPGRYTISIYADWEQGKAISIFAVDVKSS